MSDSATISTRVPTEAYKAGLDRILGNKEKPALEETSTIKELIEDLIEEVIDEYAEDVPNEYSYWLAKFSEVFKRLDVLEKKNESTD